MGVVVWRDCEEVFKELKRTQTKANEHETNKNEQMGGLFCFVRKYPEEAPPASFICFFYPPLFFSCQFFNTMMPK